MSIRSFLENKRDWAKEERVALRPRTLREEAGGLAAETTERRRGARWGPAVLQLPCALPRALGTMRLWIRPTACSSPAPWPLPPLPPGSRPLRRPLSFRVSGGRGHVWGQVYHLAGGSRFQGKED